MLRVMLRSKVHRVTVTEANLNYEGSITIDPALMEAARMIPFEQIMISNLNNGERFATYVIPGAKGSGMVCLNGPTARKGVVGDRLILFCYAHYSEQELTHFTPTIVTVDEKNRVLAVRNILEQHG